ncbi:hypothetical protein [Streptomyces sp. NPDC000410]|uniref:hypothetical protein n=1 Tax=Streptomyces sp. NPDC000410 TaxID=3154254 RepID=UPI00332083BE
MRYAFSCWLDAFANSFSMRARSAGDMFSMARPERSRSLALRISFSSGSPPGLAVSARARRVGGGQFVGVHLAGAGLGGELVEVAGRDAGGVVGVGGCRVQVVDALGGQRAGLEAEGFLVVVLVPVVEEAVLAAEHGAGVAQLAAAGAVHGLRGLQRVGQRDQCLAAALERLEHLLGVAGGGAHHLGGEDARVADPNPRKTRAGDLVDPVAHRVGCVGLAGVALAQGLDHLRVADRCRDAEGVLDRVDQVVLAAGR